VTSREGVTTFFIITHTRPYQKTKTKNKKQKTKNKKIREFDKIVYLPHKNTTANDKRDKKQF
jgi:hypothetical protein